MKLQTKVVDDILIISMDDQRANAIGNEFLSRFEEQLEIMSTHRGVVITGNQRFFSAGLDIREVHGLDRPSLQTFIQRFDDLLLNLMQLPVPTVAAVGGHAVAGGLILAFACDYRLAANGSYKVGLSELDLGIPLPMVAHEVTRRAVPIRWFFQVVAEGLLVDPATAASHGLVQQLTDNLLDDALEMAVRLARSPQAYALLKKQLLAPYLAQIATGREQVNADFVTAWFSRDAFAKREAALEKLAKR